MVMLRSPACSVRPADGRAGLDVEAVRTFAKDDVAGDRGGRAGPDQRCALDGLRHADVVGALAARAGASPVIVVPAVMPGP